MRENKVIPATQDTVFKIVMSSCPNYLSFLISEFLGVSKEEIKSKLVIKNNELSLSNAKEKKKISDFIVGIDKLLINIEMNGKYYEWLFMRNDAYLGKIEGESLNSGNDYSTLYSFLQINLNNFSYFKGNDSMLEFVYTDKKSRQIETEKVKKYHISLPKLAKKYYNGARLSKLEKALLILRVDKVSDLEKLGEGDEDLMEAVGRIREASLDINTIGLYDADLEREKIENGIRNVSFKAGEQHGFNRGVEQGIEQGLERGIECGIEQGSMQKQTAIISAMLNNGFSQEEISKITNIPIKEVKAIGL